MLLIALVGALLLVAQAPTPEETKRFEGIKARHDRGELVTVEERDFAMRYTARQKQPVAAPTPEEARRFQAVKAKRQRGEPLTPEEEQFARQMLQRSAQQQPQQNFAEYAKAHPPRESTGLVPLPDLGKGTHQGEQGGLYPDGQNTPPAPHLKAGRALARAITPLDAEGRKAESGKIVLLSIGMSNTTQEFQMFQKLAGEDTDLNPRLAIVDGAQGGQAAEITANPQANYWKVVDERIAQAGVTAKQVQVVWLKQANIRPTQEFPANARRLQGDVVATLHNLAARFPNLKIAYLSGRTYGGYAASSLNPEPHAYESGFAMKWVIVEQIAGKPELNYDAAKGEVRSPWVAWGPYLWTDGMKGRQDGFTYARDDFGPDGTHPSTSGREKVARLLLTFLKNDPTSRPWFLKSP
jgi:hypothetical protein